MTDADDLVRFRNGWIEVAWRNPDELTHVLAQLAAERGAMARARAEWMTTDPAASIDSRYAWMAEAIHDVGVTLQADVALCCARLAKRLSAANVPTAQRRALGA